MNRLSAWLERAGIRTASTREPGGTPFGLAVRGILLDPDGPSREPVSELLLYLSDRHQDIRERILPALRAGVWVLCDRYHDATLAYQGYARGVPTAVIDHLSQVLEILSPDMTVLLDMDPSKALERAIRRNELVPGCRRESRFEEERLCFHSKVRAGYLDLASIQPGRFAVIPGEAPPDIVFGCIVSAVRSRFGGEGLFDTGAAAPVEGGSDHAQ